VGVASKIQLWHDVWCEDQTLKEALVLPVLRRPRWQIIYCF